MSSNEKGRKGVKKSRLTSGSDKSFLKCEGFTDVGLACSVWINGRVKMGLMKPTSWALRKEGR